MYQLRYFFLICFCGLTITTIGETTKIPSIKLSSGHDMPIIGLGTWMIDPDDVDVAVATALDVGYTHIDTAFFYENEEAIGKSLKKYIDNGGKRENLFITTKLPMFAIRASDVEKFMKLSLERLSLQYVDMYLVHNSVGIMRPAEDKYELAWNADGTLKLDVNTDHISTWKEMEAQVKAGRARSIGLSNFNESQILRVLNHAEIKPSNLQIELQAYNQQEKLLEFCSKHEIAVTAYSTFGSPGNPSFKSTKDSIRSVPPILENPVVKKIADNHGKTPAQVLLRHMVQKNVIVIPKSKKPERIRENFDIFDFELTDEDMKEINNLDLGEDGRLFDFLVFKGIEKHPEYPY